VSDDLAVAPASGREVAVSRTVDPARERAEEKVEAFLDAARELLAEEGDFTLQMVVKRSGHSIRSFYQHFAGKHELLFAVFEESVQSAADQLTEELRGVDDPLEALHLFVVRYHRICLGGTARYADQPLQTRAMALFAQRLLIYHPDEATRAFQPIAAILRELLHRAADAEAIRTDIDDEVVGYMLQAVLFNAFVPALTGIPSSDEPDARASRLWDLLFGGLRSPES
jgi:AcrR family transcriptional regulator